MTKLLWVLASGLLAITAWSVAAPDPVDRGAAPEVRIDANPGTWPRNAAFGGDWCDVTPEPPPRPRGKYEYIPGVPNKEGIIA